MRKYVGNEVTSLKFPWFLKAKLETPYVVSCFFNGLPRQFFNASIDQTQARWHLTCPT